MAEQTTTRLCATHAVARKTNATLDEMQAAVSMQLLDVLLILTHSQANRQRLLSLGLLTALAHSMKVSPLRLHALTSIKCCCSIGQAHFAFPNLKHRQKYHAARVNPHEAIAYRVPID